jgi:hypothetical protein
VSTPSSASSTRSQACASAMLLCGFPLQAVVPDPRNPRTCSFYFAAEAREKMAEFYKAQQTLEAERERYAGPSLPAASSNAVPTKEHPHHAAGSR